MNKAILLGHGISVGKPEEYENEITQFALQKASKTVFVANVHMLVEALRDKSFSKMFNEADMVTPDGMPLCTALKWLNNIQQERMAGMDLFPSLLQRAEKDGISVFFYGSTDETLAKIIARSRELYKNLKISGFYSPPFRPLSIEEQNETIKKIHASQAGIVFVALGCPKQEKWMAEMKGKINAVMVGVGGAFPVFAQEVSRCPEWMQKYSLEWLYRLIKEPKRLWKRYTTTNSIFIFYLLKALFGKLIFSKQA